MPTADTRRVAVALGARGGRLLERRGRPRRDRIWRRGLLESQGRLRRLRIRRGRLLEGHWRPRTIAQAEKKDQAKGIAAPGVAETKAIAEEGFIYGLPLVMNYAVMNEFSMNRESGQFKGPFNDINNEARVFIYKDTAVT